MAQKPKAQAKLAPPAPPAADEWETTSGGDEWETTWEDTTNEAPVSPFSDVQSGSSWAHTTGILPGIRRGAANFASAIYNMPRAIINDSPIAPLLGLAGGDTGVEDELLRQSENYGTGLNQAAQNPTDTALRSIPGVGPDAANLAQRLPTDPTGAIAEAATTGALGYATSRAIEPLIHGTRDTMTGLRRGGRQAAGFIEKPLIEPPDAIFQRATGIDPDYVPGAMDILAEHKQRTGGQIPRSHPELEQAVKADKDYLVNYRKNFLKPQGNIVAHDSHLDIYRRKVSAVPDKLRAENFDLWERTMRDLQRELEQGPLTIDQLNKRRQELADSGLSRDPYARSSAEGDLKVALDDAWANGVRDNLYDTLDKIGNNHGSLLREINDRIDDNMMLTKNLEKNKTKSFLESRESKMDVLGEIPSKAASLTGLGGQGAFKTKFNEGIYDAIQRWTPQRGPLPANPFQPYNTARTMPTGAPPPLVGSYGAGRAGKPSTGVGYQPFPNQPGQAPPSLVNAPNVSGTVPPRAPGVTLPGTDPVTGLRIAPPQPLVGSTDISSRVPPRAPGITLPPRAGAPPLVESYMTPTGRAGTPFIGDIDPITGLRILPPPLVTTGQVIIPKPKPPR